MTEDPAMAHNSDLMYYGQEVARFVLPIPCRGLEGICDYLEDAYGQGLVMHQEDRWLVVTQPK